ncbi:TonB-dependent siderophore receptor [Elizabethkingia ursingii]|uniref:TonB-dependent siderophore receptor n=1 Tax=Elizabethkingia ursingii TaxID=1756150 RepID=A0AAJ3NA17_9FLAO|nr:TonB-dependent receptor [Elizabethkingia ursingii]AQX10355.1 TonB-dependent siderophore receptor [Elizabethkingia ursingii]MCL1664668.1 TonB-dependent receptor [Elizabethkingia ursingii]OPB72483.1 TonB-dependent siderophore receptor [Elizabethkingia ursingii]
MIKRITHLSVLVAPLFFYAQHTKSDTTSVGTIQEVSLQGTKSFRTKKSETVARLPLENLENPTVYSVVPKELISETTAIDFNTAVATVPGVVVNNGVNDSGNDIFLRGFTSNASFRNGLAINPRTQTEISNIERIEVVKGPSGTLFGGTMAKYGGVVNIITKKPQERFGGLITYTTGSWGMNRVTADVNTPLNKEKTALARFNFATFSQDSFQDSGFSKGTFFAGSVVYKVSDRLKISFDADYYAPYKTMNAFVRNSGVLTIKSLKDLTNVHDRSFTSNDIGSRRNVFNTMAEVEYKINDQWTSRTSFQRGESVENESIFLVLTYLDNNTVRRGIRPFDMYKITTNNIQQNFVGDFKIGKLRNRMVVGIDYFLQDSKNQYPMFKNNVFAVYDQVKLDDTTPWQGISRSGVNKLERTATNNQTDTFSTISGYVSDVLDVTPNLHVMGSLRWDYYNSDPSLENGVKNTKTEFSKSAFSPKFGVVYEVVKDKISAFANYVNGFTYNAPSLNQNGVMEKWAPEKGNQFEFGAKFDVLNKKLLATISYYDLRVTNRLIATPDGIGSYQDGKTMSRGIDAEVIVNPVAGLNIIAGYGYNDNKLQDRSANDGKRLIWTPKHVGNVWASYKFQSGAVEGLGLGIGANFVDKTKLDYVSGYLVPSYVNLGATIFYDRSRYRVGLKLNNASNTTYWNFYGQPQKPREILANFSFKF